LKLLNGHARVGGGHELHQTLLAGCRYGFHISVENALERLRSLPFRMVWGELPDAIKNESQLHVHWLLHP
jgi:hypothetical protein